MGDVRRFPIADPVRLARTVARDRPHIALAFQDPTVATIDHAISQLDALGMMPRVREHLCKALAEALFDAMARIDGEGK